MEKALPKPTCPRGRGHDVTPVNPAHLSLIGGHVTAILDAYWPSRINKRPPLSESLYEMTLQPLSALLVAQNDRRHGIVWMY